MTDYRRFLTQLQPADATQKFAEVRMAGNAVLIAQHGDFAAIAPSDGKQALDDVLNSLKDAGADLAPQKAWLEEVDAAVVATTPGIKYAAEQAPTWLMQLRGLAQMAAPQQSATFGEIIDSLQEGLKVFGDQVTHVALGVKADENTNLRISARTRFAAGQAWSTAAKGIKAPKEGVLAGLPTGPFELACGLTLPERIRQLAVGQIPNLFKANPVLAAVPAEQQTKLTEAAGELISSLDSLALVLAAPKAGEPQFAGHVAVLKVDDAAKYLDRYAAAVEVLAGALKPPQNPLAAYSAQKIDVDGTAVHRHRGGLEALSPPGAPEIKPAFEKMFGPGDKAHCYLAAVDDKTVVLAYVGLENLKRAIADAKATGAGLAADARVAETTALLPKGGQWLILIQPPTADDLGGALAGAGPPPTAQPPSGPPVGITAKISAAGLNIDIAAPKAALELIGASVGRSADCSKHAGSSSRGGRGSPVVFPGPGGAANSGRALHGFGRPVMANDLAFDHVDHVFGDVGGHVGHALQMPRDARQPHQALGLLGLLDDLLLDRLLDVAAQAGRPRRRPRAPCGPAPDRN